MSKRDEREPRNPDLDRSGASGGKEALKPDQQQPQGVEPDSEVDEKLRRSKRSEPSALEPNTIVRN